MNVNLRRLRILPLAVLLTLAVAGCATTGTDTGHATATGELAGHAVADSDNDGVYVTAQGISYQLQVSRLMNPWGVEDAQYLKGLPTGVSATRLSASQLWYGVFLWAKNQHHHAYNTSDRFEIVDTMGNTYTPLKLNPSVNPYAWSSQRLQFGETEPGEDTTAANGFTGGKLVLFRLNQSIYNNRPLTLYILSPSSGRRIASISLDL